MQHTRLYKGGRQAEIHVCYPKKLQQFPKVICNNNAATSQQKPSYLFSKKLSWSSFLMPGKGIRFQSATCHMPTHTSLLICMKLCGKCVLWLTPSLPFPSALFLFSSALGIQFSRLAWQRILPLITQLSTIWHLHQSPSQSSEYLNQNPISSIHCLRITVCVRVRAYVSVIVAFFYI